MRRSAAILLLLPAVACGSPAALPTHPSLRPEMPAVTTPAPSGWMVTTLVTAVEPPAGCRVIDRTPGIQHAYQLFVARDDTARSLQMILNVKNYPTDDDGEYSGVLDGDRFVARGRFYEATTPCVGEPPVNPMLTPEYSADLSGQFNADGTALTATEVQTYRLLSGGLVVYRLTWTAVRY